MRQSVRLRLIYVIQARYMWLMHKTLRILARVAFSLLPSESHSGVLHTARKSAGLTPRCEEEILCSRNQPPGLSFSWVLSAFQPCFCSSPLTRYDAFRRKRNSRI